MDFFQEDSVCIEDSEEMIECSGRLCKVHNL